MLIIEIGITSELGQVPLSMAYRKAYKEFIGVLGVSTKHCYSIKKVA